MNQLSGVVHLCEWISVDQSDDQNKAGGQI